MKSAVNSAIIFDGAGLECIKNYQNSHFFKKRITHGNWSQRTLGALCSWSRACDGGKLDSLDVDPGNHLSWAAEGHWAGGGLLR